MGSPGIPRLAGRFLLSCAGLVVAWAAAIVLLVVAGSFLDLHWLRSVPEAWLPGSFVAACALGLVRSFSLRSRPDRAGLPRWLLYGPAIALAAAVVGAYAWTKWSPAARFVRADSKELRSTVVLAHPSRPIPAGKNALWCGTVQLAWDALRRETGGGPIVLDPAPDVAAALNGDSGDACRLPPKAFVARAGFASRGILGTIRKDVEESFGSDAPAVPDPPPHPGAVDTLAFFAALRRDLPFAHPFESYAERLAFAGGEPRVRAFGMNEDSEAPDMREIMGQVRHAWVDPVEQRGHLLEFTFRGGEDRMFVAMMPREASLRETWRKATGIFEAGKAVRLRHQVLAVPKMNFEVSHDFAEFAGVRFPGGHPITLSRQVTRFRLDERGASLSSYSLTLAAMLSAPPRRIIVDRPFLLGLVRAGAEEPYFLLWVENDELLDR